MKVFCVQDIFSGVWGWQQGGGGEGEGFLAGKGEEVKGRRGSLRRERKALGKKARMKMLRKRNW